MQLRREAEALLAERKGETQGSKKNGVGAKGTAENTFQVSVRMHASAAVAVSSMLLKSKDVCIFIEHLLWFT